MTEFSRLVRLDTIGTAPLSLALAATAAECAALATRFGLTAIGTLEATVTLQHEATGLRLAGRLRAEVTQACVVSDAPVQARLDDPLDILFLPEPAGRQADEEVELAETELDVMFHDGAAIDVGEAVAQSLLLALDPYPRAPDSAEVSKAAGLKSEAEAGPFGALAGLRDQLRR